MPAPIEFWYDFGSNYSYLAMMRIGPLAAAQGVTIVWRPFLLGPIFQSMGWDNSPFVLQKAKGDYVWKDMAREARKLGLPLRRPSTFPSTAVLATRIALLGAAQPWCGEFSARIMACNFEDDRDIGDPGVVHAVVQDMGLDADALIAHASEAASKAALREQVACAQARGVFGAPTFLVGEDMFWGNDRLDDALRAARDAV